MNQAAALFPRFFGKAEPVPQTRLSRFLRRTNRFFFVLGLLYVALQAFPQVLFAHHVTENNITFYSRNPLSADVAACAARARGLLQRSELAAPERPERVFVCDSPWLFSLFSPTSAGAFAFSVPGTDNVFVAAADFPADVARSRDPIYDTRALSAVVAHEITHGLIRRRLGWRRGILLPTWIAEGYCDYVAGEGSFPEATGRSLMAFGRSDPSASFRYFEYRQMVQHLMDERHLSFAQLVERADDAESVKAQTRQAMRDRAGR